MTFAPIDQLPVELLRHIFVLYYRETSAPVLLLFVCRLWHRVALDIPNLWSTVRFAPYRNVKNTPIGEQICERYTCYTFEQLYMMAVRTKMAKLNIYCELDDFDTAITRLFPKQYPRSLDINTLIVRLTEGEVFPHLNRTLHRHRLESIKARCQSLHVIHNYGLFDFFVAMFDDLPSLELLELEGGPSSSMNCFLSSLSNSPKLRTLRGAYPNPFFYSRQNHLLNQVQVLQIPAPIPTIAGRPNGIAELVRQCSGLRSLELLSPNPYAPTITLVSGVAPIFQVPVSTGGRSHPITPNLSHLVHLALYTSSREGYYQLPSGLMELPRLKSLEILQVGSVGKLEHIHAPVLDSLRLETEGRQPSKVELPEQLFVRPRRLTIDDTVTADSLALLLRTAWNDLEEIHFINHNPRSTLLEALVLTLAVGNPSNGGISAPACPKLRVLSVLTRSLCQKVDLRQLEGRRDLLKDVVNWRKERGLHELHDVRCGWRHTLGRTEDWLRVSI